MIYRNALFFPKAEAQKMQPEFENKPNSWENWSLSCLAGQKNNSKYHHLVQVWPKQRWKTTVKFPVSQHSMGGQTKWEPASGSSPSVHGKKPGRTAAAAAMAPHERFRPEAGRRTTWSWRKSIVPSLKGRNPRRSSTMVCGTYQNIWQTSAFFPFIEEEVLFFRSPPTCHPPIRPPHCPVSLFGPQSSKRAAQCALTPCNEISSCC